MAEKPEDTPIYTVTGSTSGTSQTDQAFENN